MDNEKGFIAIIIAAVAILIGLALYTGSVTPAIGQMTVIQTSTNASFTMPALSATSELTPCGQKAVTYTLMNTTTGTAISTNNYTITQGVGTDGYLAAKVTSTSANYSETPIKVTCTYQSKGYVDDGASRGMIGIIAIMFVLLIAVAAIPDLRNGIIDFAKGK